MDHVLCVGDERTVDLLARGGTARKLGGGEVHVVHRGARPPSAREFVLRLVDDAHPASFQGLGPVDAVVVDERPDGSGGPCPRWEETRSRRVLPGLLAAGVRPERLLALLPAAGAAAEVAWQLGRRRAGGVLVEPFRASDVLARLHALVGGRPVGKIALCLAGGGIEGLIFELGVLRALDAFMPERGVADLDLFCGISAGAVIGAFLANGVSPDDLARGMRFGTAGIDRVRRGMLFLPSAGEIRTRLSAIASAFAGPLRLRSAASVLFRAVPGSIFSGGPVRRWLERQLTREGRTNSFRQLRRPLYVGATDQDTGEHVVFGEPGWDDVPVSQAVRASTALTPFYPSERIKGRWYVDGGFTRTANISVALRHGATLVVVVDPLVPVQAPEPGYVRARGGVYAGLQGLKSLIDSRFVRSLEKFRELHPEVDVHVIRPDGEEMRMLSGSPMKYFYREEIHDRAYEKTVAELRARLSDLGRDFVRHGVPFRDPSRLARVSDPEEALARGRIAAAI